MTVEREIPELVVIPQPCESCGASIFFAVMKTTRARMPLNARPDDEGNVLYPWGYSWDDEVHLAAVLRVDELKGFRRRRATPIYRSHFDTCPDADEHRSRPAS